MARLGTPALIRTLALAAPLVAPLGAQAASFCVAVNGGFGGGGTSYVAPAFTVPTANHCAPWSGFTKLGSSVVAFATGTGCVSSTSKVLTLSISNTDPSFFGIGVAASDQITLCPAGTTGCPISGQDVGSIGGTAVEQTCTASLLKLPQTHD